MRGAEESASPVWIVGSDDRVDFQERNAKAWKWTFSGRSLSNLKQRFFYRDKGCLSDPMRRAAPVLAHFKAQKPVLVETGASDSCSEPSYPRRKSRAREDDTLTDGLG